jgi:excisionase family DNA binding protein
MLVVSNVSDRLGCMEGSVSSNGYATGPVFGRAATQVRMPARARKQARRFEQVVADTSPGPVELTHGDERAEVPAELLDLLRTVMRAVNSGEAVTVVVGGPETDQELSSQAVADLLNVSRPFVVKLAKHGDLPHRMVGNRHRFRLADVLAYRQLAARQRSTELAALAPVEGYQPGDF